MLIYQNTKIINMAKQFCDIVLHELAPFFKWLLLHSQFIHHFYLKFNPLFGLFGFDGDSLLKHSFQRSIYAIPLASNWKDALIGEYKKPDYFDYPLQELVTHWKERWLSMRLKNQNIVDEVSKFKVEQFIVL